VNSYDLAQYDDSFKGAEVPADGDFPALPDGPYGVTVERSEIKRVSKGKNEGKPMILVGMVVASGDYANRWIWKTMVPSADPQRMGYIKRDLLRLGIPESASFHDLPDLLDEIKGNAVEVNLVTKGEYQNVYINGPSFEKRSVEDDLDIPF
jgi:hypothetical protein